MERQLLSSIHGLGLIAFKEGLILVLLKQDFPIEGVWKISSLQQRFRKMRVEEDSLEVHLKVP
jgi:hypothetical protein